MSSDELNEAAVNILAVDDDRLMLTILKTQLESLDYKVITARDGQEAWDILQEKKGDIDIVVIDREMPRMDGLEVVSKMKEDSDLKNIPVIMQTGSDRAEQIKEGIDAGVYYYLTKPIDEEILSSVLSSATREVVQQRTLNSELSLHKTSFSLINKAKFSLNTLVEAESLACFLANCFEQPERVVSGLAELLINAIEHGNLGVGYDEKTRLINEGIWRDEILKRSKLPENKEKQVKVYFSKDEEDCSIRIVDCGNGFDWHKYMEIDPSRALDNHGRGIAHATAISFEKIIYNDTGNEVTCFISNKSDLDW